MRSIFARIMRSGLVLAAVLALTALLPSAAFATRSLGLSAGVFEFDVAQGGTVNGEVIVSNDGTEPITVMVYSSDQKVDDKGTITYVAPTRADLSAASNPSTWIRVAMPANSKSIGNIPYLKLAPGEKVPVKFELTVPSGTPSGDHNLLLFFESFDLPKGGQTVQSVISGRIGARVRLRVTGDVVEKLEVRPFNVPTIVYGSSVPYNFLVRNVGNVDQRVGARIMLLDRNDNEMSSQIPIDGRIVFASSNLEASGTVVTQKTVIGPHKLRLDVTKVEENGQAANAGKGTITEVRDVWFIPLWLIILAGVLVVLVVVRVIWSAMARSARRNQERGAARARGQYGWVDEDAPRDGGPVE